jgi:cupin superfamily acireductone dioxygenase involved in methionine salvage
MKKILFCVLVLCLVVTASVFAEMLASRVAIDEVVKAYEELIVEAENLAAMPQIAALEEFTALQQKAGAMESKIVGIENEKEWTIQDTVNLVNLRIRFNKAMTAAAKIIIKY